MILQVSCKYKLAIHDSFVPLLSNVAVNITTTTTLCWIIGLIELGGLVSKPHSRFADPLKQPFISNNVNVRNHNVTFCEIISN